MYLEFYGLSEKPFSQTPDPRFLYWNDEYRETLASLAYGIRERKGFIAMLGEAGTGKTTLLRKLLEDLGDEIISVFLFNPNATFEEILEYTLSELGITAPTGRKLAMLQRLNEFLLAAFAEGRNTILLIDEAQDLEPDVLESLRLLSNLETSQEKILQIVLSGQPELADKLNDPGLRQLKQRIAVRCRLEPLKREELESFIRARLAVAGGSQDIFAPDAFDPIWRFTNGIPRLVNTACDNALLVGYALGRRILDRGVIEEVIRDLENLDIGLAGPRKAADQPTDAAGATLAPEPPPAEPPVTPSPQPTASAAAPASMARANAAEAPIRTKPPIAPARADPARRSSLPWMVAAVLAGLVLLLAGAWLGRVGVPAAMTPGDGSVGLAPRASDEGPSKDASVDPRMDPPIDPSVESHPESAPAAASPPDASGQNRSDHGAAPPATAPAPPARKAPAIPPTSEAGPPEPAPGDRAVAPKAGAASEPATQSAAPAAPPEPASEQRRVVRAPAPAPPAHPEPAREPVTAEPEEVEPAAEAQPERHIEVASLARTELPIPLQAGRRGATTATNGAPRKQIPVVRGDTLHELAARRYGSSNLTTLDMLRSANPQIRDIDLIIAGSGLVFPDPGPESRVLSQTDGFAVLAVTTPTLSNALAVQSSLEDRLDKPVSLERVEGEGRTNLYRVSVRGIGDRGEAVEIAERLGPILRDPTP